MAKVTDPMRRTLQLVKKHGAAERSWTGTHGHEWVWKIGGEKSPQQQVCKALCQGYLVGVTRDRVVLTDRGRRLIA